MAQDSHDSEYNDAMVAVLEWLWGRDFMAPGGAGNIEKMLRGIETRDREILDIGSGLGGPAFLLSRDYQAEVTGIDIEPHLLARARQRAQELNLQRPVIFEQVSPGPLPFEDRSFDIVFSSGAITQVDDKSGMFLECARVLRPGGYLTVYDWLKAEGDYSPDMMYFFEMEGLTYSLATLEETRKVVQKAGFDEVSVEDASDWYRVKSRSEYEQLKREFDRIERLIGTHDANHMLENWRALVVVCEQGELRQAYTRARKPAEPG